MCDVRPVERKRESSATGARGRLILNFIVDKEVLDGAQRVEATAQKLTEIVQGVHDLSEKVQSISAAAEELYASSHEIVASMNQVADSAQQGAAGNIAKLVRGIEGEMDTALSAMGQSSQEVTTGAQTVGQASQLLAEIVKGVEALTERAQGVSAAAHQINASTNEVVHAMQSVAAMQKKTPPPAKK